MAVGSLVHRRQTRVSSQLQKAFPYEAPGLSPSSLGPAQNGGGREGGLAINSQVDLRLQVGKGRAPSAICSKKDCLRTDPWVAAGGGASPFAKEATSTPSLVFSMSEAAWHCLSRAFLEGP